MRRVVLLSMVAVIVLALSGASMVLGKAHVPQNRVQICTKGGVVQNATLRRSQSRLNNGACRLTACAFDDVDDNGGTITQRVFFPGDNCDSTDQNGDGFCDATGSPSDVPKRLRAINVTPACTLPF